jgi:hypothetical protein
VSRRGVRFPWCDMSSHEYTGQPTFSGALHKVNKEVTRAGQKLRSDDTIRGFLDKAHGAVAFDPIKKAVVKATSLEHGPPKEKHVQFLMHEMRDGNVKEIFNELFNRLHNKDATTVLKSLMVFHRLFNGCPTNYKLLERVYVSRGEFRLSRFLDEDTHESMQVPRPSPEPNRPFMGVPQRVAAGGAWRCPPASCLDGHGPTPAIRLLSLPASACRAI